MFPRAEAESVFSTFCKGWLVSISQERDNEATFKKVHGVDEIWSMAFRKPRNGQGRMLGRFLERNVFVGLGLHTREELGANFMPLAEHAIQVWDRYLDQQEPLRSESNDDYIDGVMRNLDQDD